MDTAPNNTENTAHGSSLTLNRKSENIVNTEHKNQRDTDSDDDDDDDDDDACVIWLNVGFTGCGTDDGADDKQRMRLYNVPIALIAFRDGDQGPSQVTKVQMMIMM